jgi:hypothetical protein
MPARPVVLARAARTVQTVGATANAADRNQ